MGQGSDEVFFLAEAEAEAEVATSAEAEAEAGLEMYIAEVGLKNIYMYKNRQNI